MVKRNLFLLFISILLLIYEVFLVAGNTFDSFYVWINILVPIFIIYVYIVVLIRQKFNGAKFSFANFLTFIPILVISNVISFFINSLLFSKYGFQVSINSYYMIMNFFEISVFLVIYLLFYKEEINTQFKVFIKNIFKYFKYILLFYLLAIILNAVLSTIATYIPATVEEAANQSAIEGILSIDSSNLFFIFSLVFIGPIVEEFIYRYLLIERVLIKGFKIKLMKREELKRCSDKKLVYKTYISMILIAIVSGFLFSSAHAIAATSLVNYIRDLLLYLGFSIAISMAYIYTRNVFVTIGIHIFNNLISVLVVINLLKQGIL